MSRSTDLYERARRRIPGGTQLLSKKPELFLPGAWPAYYRRASGVEVEDLDGKTYVDVTIHAVGSCPLGYADADVESAVISAVRAGNMTTLNCPEEVELADTLCELHPWAEMVRYARGGGEAMAVAVRTARAATGRERIAFCGYHGWHDWYLAANLQDPTALDVHLLPGIDTAGVPSKLKGSTVGFGYGDRDAFDGIVEQHGEQLAAVVMEPARLADPPAGFLEHVAETTRRLGAVLVFDEITSGFRMTVGGAHLLLGVEPDIVVFAKAMSNGYPMAAIVGRRDAMEAVASSFVSSTYWSERIGPAAALATLAKLRERNVPQHLCVMGERMRAGWIRLAEQHGLEIAVKGIPPLPSFAFRHGDDSRAMATLYTQCMLDEGFLASGAFYPCYAHQPVHVDSALESTDRAFGEIRSALSSGKLLERLRGELAHSGPARRGR